jgi:hypothetical protein
LSDETLAHRLELLLARTIVEPARLVADLPRRTRWGSLHGVLAPVRDRRRGDDTLLALDWSGRDRELLIGRSPGCDVRLSAGTVSRRHARLVFRDGGWVIQDIGSLNGTLVNGVPIGRCRLRPGDRLTVADQLLRVD